ncbi:MAG: recombination regulator RecX [Firmicutes bacterium]|nr:recombination regulator RecX [Bacillota bacterium]
MQSGELNAKSYLFAQLSKKALTECEASEKLAKKGFSREETSKAITIAKDYGYINDLNYCKNYFLSRSSLKGFYKIKQELIQRGVPSEVILLSYQDSEINEKSAVKNLAEKFLKNKESDPKIKEKLFRHLAGKGFGFEVINETINNMF